MIKREFIAGVLFLAAAPGQGYAASLANCSVSNGASFSGVVLGTTLTSSIGATTASFDATISTTTLTILAGTQATFDAATTTNGTITSISNFSGTIAVGETVSATPTWTLATITGFSPSATAPTSILSVSETHASRTGDTAGWPTVTGTVAIGQVVTAGATTGTTIIGGSGTSWTITPSQTVSSVTAMTTAFATSSGALAAPPAVETVLGTGLNAATTITAGSGNTWTLSAAPSSNITTSTTFTATYDLTSAAITTLLSNTGTYSPATAWNYATDPTGNNHEAWFPASNNVYDYKKGPAATGNTDPAGLVGTAVLTVSTALSPGFLTNTYGSASFPWFISPILTTQAAGAGSYNFCSTSGTGGTIQGVTVSNASNPG